MWKKKEPNGFDAAVWKGPMDVRTATVRIAMMVGLGAIWLGLVFWIFFSG